MCEPQSSMSLRGPVLAVAGALALGLAAHVLAAVAGFLVGVAAIVAVLAVVFVVVMRRLVHLSVVHWPAMQAQRAPRLARARAALPAPRLAIPAPKEVVIPGVVLSGSLAEVRQGYREHE